MNDGLGPFTEFMQAFELADTSHHLVPEEKAAIVELAQGRFLNRSSDPRLVEIVNRLCERPADAPKRKHR